MRKILLATVAIATLSAPAAHANELGGIVGGLAGGLIAGAIIGSMQPHTVYVVPVRRHYYAAPARTRTVVVHDHTTVVRTVVAPAPAPVVVAAPQPVVVAAPAPAAPANNNNIVMAPASAQAPVIINNAPAAAPQPIIINTTAPAPVAAPQVAAPVSTAFQEFTKTADYLACLKGTPVADATKN